MPRYLPPSNSSRLSASLITKPEADGPGLPREPPSEYITTCDVCVVILPSIFTVSAILSSVFGSAASNCSSVLVKSVTSLSCISDSFFHEYLSCSDESCMWAPPCTPTQNTNEMYCFCGSSRSRVEYTSESCTVVTSNPVSSVTSRSSVAFGSSPKSTLPPGSS